MCTHTKSFKTNFKLNDIENAKRWVLISNCRIKKHFKGRVWFKLDLDIQIILWLKEIRWKAHQAEGIAWTKAWGKKTATFGCSCNTGIIMEKLKDIGPR